MPTFIIYIIYFFISKTLGKNLAIIGYKLLKMTDLRK